MCKIKLKDIAEVTSPRQRKEILNTARAMIFEKKEDLIRTAREEIKPIPKIENKKKYFVFKFRDLCELNVRIEDEKTLFITYLRVIPSLRHGLELGRILIDNLIEFARKHNVKYIEVNARDIHFSDDTNDAPTIHPYEFYKKLGFIAGMPPEHITNEKTVKDMIKIGESIPMYYII